LKQETTERIEGRLSRLALADRRQQLLLERLEPAVEEVLLGGEVVEDGRLGYVRRPGDLGDRDAVKPAFCKQVPGRVGYQLPCLLLLALAQPRLLVRL
jgi:hypothetical protein